MMSHGWPTWGAPDADARHHRHGRPMDHGGMDMGGMTAAGMMTAEDMDNLAMATGARLRHGCGCR